ncbi:MAG: asparagine synthase-related protein [Actinomycetota bacterium]|nr:asparagine synthase-related protein [Actinomycetota bacterium]
MINLNKNKGFKWHNRDGIYVKGYLFDDKDNYYYGEKMLNYFSSANNPDNFERLLKNANGFFSVIIEKNDIVLAAVDRVRSFPLFYSSKNNSFHITDDAYLLRDELKLKKISEISSVEYLLTAYVTGSDTLYDEIKQIQAGEYLFFDSKNSKLKLEDYFIFKHNESKNENVNELSEDLEIVYKNVANRLITILGNRTAIVPLSGGIDSRVIAILLKESGYEDVICFTYGKPSNLESCISKEVAEYLGYKWLFIPYKRKDLYNSFYCDERRKYSRFSNNIASVSHLQDWNAVEYLKNNKLIPEDSVFIPGHTGSFAGGNISLQDVNKKNFMGSELINYIFNKHYCRWDWSGDRSPYYNIFVEKNKQLYGIKYDKLYSNIEAANLFELWDWRERQSKYICNSVRVYEFWDYQWLMPLCDNELMMFWSKLSLKERAGKKFLKRYVKTIKKMKIPLYNEKKFSKIRKYYERLTNIYYSRFIGYKFFPVSLFFTFNRNIKGFIKYPFIKPYNLTIKEDSVGLEAMVELYEIINDKLNNF